MLTEAQKTEMRANIARGIKYLDENIPDWRSKIDWKSFDFINPTKCVWGQLRYGGESFKGLPATWHEHSCYGFDIPEIPIPNEGIERNEDNCPYAFMNAEWLRQKPE
jgi:hypothetical protein